MQCPYCGTAIKRQPEHIPMGKFRADVYRFILSSGQKGVSNDALMDKFFAGKSRITVRTTIHYINKKIYPLRAVSDGGVYRIVQTKYSS